MNKINVNVSKTSKLIYFIGFIYQQDVGYACHSRTYMSTILTCYMMLLLLLFVLLTFFLFFLSIWRMQCQKQEKKGQDYSSSGAPRCAATAVWARCCCPRPRHDPPGTPGRILPSTTPSHRQQAALINVLYRTEKQSVGFKQPMIFIIVMIMNIVIMCTIAVRILNMVKIIIITVIMIIVITSSSSSSSSCSSSSSYYYSLLSQVKFLFDSIP